MTPVAEPEAAAALPGAAAAAAAAVFRGLEIYQELILVLVPENKTVLMSLKNTETPTLIHVISDFLLQ